MDQNGKMRLRLYVRVRPKDRRAMLAWVATARHRIPGELLEAISDYAGSFALRAAVIEDDTADAVLQVDAATYKERRLYDTCEGLVYTPHCTLLFEFDGKIAVAMMRRPGLAPGGPLDFLSVTEFKSIQDDGGRVSHWAGQRNRYTFYVTAWPRKGRCDLALRGQLRTAGFLLAGTALPQNRAVLLDPTKPDEMWGLVATEAEWDLSACGWLRTG